MDKSIYLTIFVFLILISINGSLAGHLVLESYATCPVKNESPVQVISMNLKTNKHKLFCNGELKVTEEFAKNDVVANVDFRQCPTNDTCGRMTSIQVKDICKYLVEKSLFGNPFGNYFTPRFACPPKPGNYKLNLTINIKPLARLPLAKFRTWTRMIISENLPNNRKRPLMCFENIIVMKD